MCREGTERPKVKKWNGNLQNEPIFEGSDRFRRYPSRLRRDDARPSKARPRLDDNFLFDEADPPAQLAYDYFADEQGEDKVLGLLKKSGLDMRAVETEALRLSLDDVERVDRLIASAEVRRKKAFRFAASAPGWRGPLSRVAAAILHLLEN